MAQDRHDEVDLQGAYPQVIEVVHADPGEPIAATASYHTTLDRAPDQQTSVDGNPLNRASGIASQVAGDIAEKVRLSSMTIADKVQLSLVGTGTQKDRLDSWVRVTGRWRLEQPSDSACSSASSFGAPSSSVRWRLSR